MIKHISMDELSKKRQKNIFDEFLEAVVVVCFQTLNLQRFSFAGL